jgi:hypothetical protein
MQLPEPRVLGLKKQTIYEIMILQELKVGGILDQLSNEAAKHRLPIRPGFMKEMDVEREIGLECPRKLGTYKGGIHLVFAFVIRKSTIEGHIRANIAINVLDCWHWLSYFSFYCDWFWPGQCHLQTGLS